MAQLAGGLLLQRKLEFEFLRQIVVELRAPPAKDDPVCKRPGSCHVEDFFNCAHDAGEFRALRGELLPACGGQGIVACTPVIL